MQLKIDVEQKTSVGHLHFEYNVLTMSSGRFLNLITPMILPTIFYNVFKFSVDFFQEHT